MKKILMFVGGGLLVVAASIGGSVLVTGARDAPDAPDVPTGPAAALPSETHYYYLQPEFVINLPPPSKRKFLMVELAVSVADETLTAVIDDHMPELRNELLMLFSSKTGDMLASEEGKNQLREQARQTIESLIAKHHSAEPVSDVFFTRFVMQ